MGALGEAGLLDIHMYERPGSLESSMGMRERGRSSWKGASGIRQSCSSHIYIYHCYKCKLVHCLEAAFQGYCPTRCGFAPISVKGSKPDLPYSTS
jgi:hypothetical protein